MALSRKIKEEKKFEDQPKEEIFFSGGCFFDRNKSIQIFIKSLNEKMIIDEIKGVYESKKDGLEVGPPAMLAKQIEYVKGKLSFAAVKDFESDNKKHEVRSLKNLNTSGLLPIIIDPKDLEPGEKLQLIFNDQTPVCDNITLKDGSVLIKQPAVYRISTTEYRLSLNHVLPIPINPFPLTKEGKLIYSPKTDLHTHFGGIPTADMLISALVKMQKEKIVANYPVRLLKKFGLDLGIYFPTEEAYVEFQQKYNVALKAFEEDKSRGALKFEEYCQQKKLLGYLFDITSLVNPELQINKEKKRENLELFRNYLHIPKEQSIIFNEMESFYKYREIFVKNVSLFKFLLWEIAKEYQRQGIIYAEISYVNVVDPAYLKILHEEIDKIEEMTGVRMRFLNSIVRGVSNEVRIQQFEYFKAIASKSPYVSGVDILAAETNSTYDLYPQLIDLANWAQVNYPGMVIRIHAGEYSYHPENIEGVVKLAESYPNLCFRVGHGVYGYPPSVIERMKQCKNLIVEINMASNVALNSKLDIGRHSLFTYIRENIPLVLGSDGNGLYDSHAQELVKLLSYSRNYLDIEHFLKQLSKTEKNYMDYVDKIYYERNQLFQYEFMKALKKIITPSSAVAFSVILKALCLEEKESDLSKYHLADICKKAIELGYFDGALKLLTKDSEDKLKLIQFDIEMRIKQDKLISAVKPILLESFCKEHKITLITDSKYSKFTDLKKEKTPIMITGIINKEMINKDLPAAKKFIESLLASLDPEKIDIVTSGTDIGINKLVHELVYAYNIKASEKGKPVFNLVGYVPSSIKAEDLSLRLTSVIVVHDVATWYDIYQYIDKQVREHNLTLLVMGGNAWQRDLTLVVHNALTDPSRSPRSSQEFASRLFLMSNIKGASQQKARELPKHYQCNCQWSEEVFLRFQAAGLIKKGVKFNEKVNKVPYDESLSELHGRYGSSTTSEIAAKFLMGLELEYKKLRLMPAEKMILTNPANIEEFIVYCETKPDNVNTTVFFKTIEAIMASNNKSTLAYQVVLMAINWKIKIPDSLKKYLSQDQQNIVFTPKKGLARDPLISPGSLGLYGMRYFKKAVGLSKDQPLDIHLEIERKKRGF